MKLKILGVCSLMSAFCFNQVLAGMIEIDQELIENLDKEYSDVQKELKDLKKAIKKVKKATSTFQSAENSEESAEDAEEAAEEITLDENFTFANSIDFLDKVKQAGQLTDSNKENIQRIFEKFKINKSVDDVSDSWWTQVFRQIWAVGIISFRTKISQFHDKIRNFDVSSDDISKMGENCFADEQGYSNIFESKIFNTMLISDNGNRNNSDKKIELTKTWGNIRSKLYANALKSWNEIKEMDKSDEGYNEALNKLRETVGELRSNVTRITSNPEVDELFGKKRPQQPQGKKKKNRKGK